MGCSQAKSNATTYLCQTHSVCYDSDNGPGYLSNVQKVTLEILFFKMGVRVIYINNFFLACFGYNHFMSFPWTFMLIVKLYVYFFFEGIAYISDIEDDKMNVTNLRSLSVCTLPRHLSWTYMPLNIHTFSLDRSQLPCTWREDVVLVNSCLKPLINFKEL